MRRRPIPQTSPGAGYAAEKHAIDEAVARVLASGRYILGAEVEAFEAAFAAYLGGAVTCVGVGSGTAALTLALQASGIGPGDGVVTVSHTATATVAAIELTGASPLLVDIDAAFGLDAAHLDAVVRLAPVPVRAIVPVHLYGQAVDLDAIWTFARAHGLVVVEDCAQAAGATWQGHAVGTRSDAAAFSFYPTKNLAAFGDAGLVASPDPAIAARARALRQYGWRDHGISESPGANARLDEIQAAILRTRLPHLDAHNAARTRLAALYDRHLAEIGIAPARRTGAGHVFHQYVVRARERAALQADLARAGIATGVHYPVPVHRQPAYAGRLWCRPGGLPETERAADTVLSLPMFPQLSVDDARDVAATVRRATAGRRPDE